MIPRVATWSVLQLEVLSGALTGLQQVFVSPTSVRLGTAAGCEFSLPAQSGLHALHLEFRPSPEGPLLLDHAGGTLLHQENETTLALSARTRLPIDATLSLGSAGLKLRARWGLEVPFGRYLLHGALGAGGMAQVFTARKIGPRGMIYGEVVLKLIQPRLYSLGIAEEMLLDEARIAAAINHANVVRVFEVGAEDGVLFLEMEYLRGLTLGQLSTVATRGGKALPADLCAALMAQACAGLHAAHEVRDSGGALLAVVHRDISPGNLMVNPDGVVKVIDFGIARACGRFQDTQVGLFKGKLSYAAPEQLNPEAQLDRRVDVYAAAVVLYELLMGKRLFARNNDKSTLAAVLMETAPPLRSLRSDVPARLSELVECALSRNPQQRPQTALEMAVALQECVEEAGGRFSGPESIRQHLVALGLPLLGPTATPLTALPAIITPSPQPGCRTPPIAPAPIRPLPPPLPMPEELAGNTTQQNMNAVGAEENTRHLVSPGDPQRTSPRVSLPAPSVDDRWWPVGPYFSRTIALSSQGTRQPRPLPFLEIPSLRSTPLLALVDRGDVVLKLDASHGTGRARIYLDPGNPSSQALSFRVNGDLDAKPLYVGHRTRGFQLVRIYSRLNTDRSAELCLPLPEAGLILCANGAPTLMVVLLAEGPGARNYLVALLVDVRY